jgi:membrane protein DedA with SNARE-associated domain
VSAWCGDQVSYLLGHRFGDPVVARFVRGARGAKTIAWARRSLEERAAVLLVLARFVPGGRTALTLTAGSTHFDRRRFRIYTAVAAVLWGTYSAGLGYLGGRTFKDDHWLALGVALAGGFAVTGLIEAGRWVAGRRASARSGRG